MEARLVAVGSSPSWCCCTWSTPPAVLLDGFAWVLACFPAKARSHDDRAGVVAALLFALAGAMAFLPGTSSGVWPAGRPVGLTGALVGKRVTVPALEASGVRTAIGLVASAIRIAGSAGLVGFRHLRALGLFHAFGFAPPTTVILMAYFLGMVGNLLPLPDGLGGVEGGMIGAFAASSHLDQAVLTVLAYREISFWLPTVPGAIAYFQFAAQWRAGAASRRLPSPLQRSRSRPLDRFTPSRRVILYKVKRMPARLGQTQGV